IWFDPGITEGDVCGFGYHVIAEIAGRVLEEPRAPVAVHEIPPVFLANVAVGKVQPCAIPTGGTLRRLDAVVHADDGIGIHPHLPRQTFDEACALHVAAEQSKCVGNTITHDMASVTRCRSTESSCIRSLTLLAR